MWVGAGGGWRRWGRGWDGGEVARGDRGVRRNAEGVEVINKQLRMRWDVSCDDYPLRGWRRVRVASIGVRGRIIGFKDTVKG